MPDFTSSLYLGFRHASQTLEPWESLTIGAPAALSEPARHQTIAQGLAGLQGLERGVLAPSTLHLFWDLFGVLRRGPVAIFYDVGIYPIARWGIERAAAHGILVRRFSHHDASVLRTMLAGCRRSGNRPLVVSDGFCPTCGRGAPLRDYHAAARAHGGLLIVDDTQALGIFGQKPDTATPYGRGGGGSLRWSGVEGPDIITISSLAKGFGAPLAVLCGSGEIVARFEALSETRVHSSPPSTAAVHAAAAALNLNATIGDAVRQRLAGLVVDFRRRLNGCGLQIAGGLFPMQTLVPRPGLDALALHEHLLRQGIRTVLHKRHGRMPLLSFIITARHTLPELKTTVAALRHVARIPASLHTGIGPREFVQ